MQDLKITIIQSDISWENAERNLDMFGNKIDSIKGYTDLIVLPEMFNTGFSVKNKECAETSDGITMQWLKQKAEEKNCVITGSIFMKENNKYYNRLIWMRQDGTYEIYNKRHLFQLVNEQDFISPGKKRKVFNLNGWKILPQICYDLRFPVWSKNTFYKGEYEYDLIIYIANWPEPRNYSWKSLLIARAIENQAYVVGVNRIAKDGFGIPHSGDSVIINYRGRIITNIKANSDSLKTKTLSYSELFEFRQYFKIGMDWDNFDINI